MVFVDSYQARYQTYHLDSQFLICVSCGEQGGLIGLAAATVGLASEAAQHLKVNLFSPWLFFTMVECVFLFFFLSCLRLLVQVFLLSGFASHIQ